jgi:HD superfamily phosphohydrolase
MDFAYTVYPAAEHSRFTHSLGVCQAAKSLFDTIADNVRRRSPSRGRQPDTSTRERPIAEPFRLFDRVLVGLAALLHDLSHPPFSHAFDARPDLLEHDNFETNPFLLRALFDNSSSELAQVLREWDPNFQLLLEAESHPLIDSALPAFPGVAALVFEILAVKATDDSGEGYYCLCPSAAPETLASEQLTQWAGSGWDRTPVALKRVHVKTSAFFRRLHCNIVANTISADLLDYIRRDTRVAGLPRDLDRHFYSYISSAEYRGRHRVVVELEDRQGHVRRDALSDLMNCMELRYIIHERIVLHRAVVAARAMAARLYPPVPDAASNQWAVVERMYGKWARPLSDAEVLGGRYPVTEVEAGGRGRVGR